MIRLENVSFGYKKHKYILQDINLLLMPSHVYGLLGMNGVGKSTLLYLITNLLRPQQGTISYKNSADRKWQNKIEDFFFVPEEFDLPNISIRNYLKINVPFYPKFSEDDFFQYLSLFGIDCDNRLGELSMGQKKKFYLSFAHSANTALLILDEPTNGLDIVSKQQFRDFISQSTENSDKCIILSTHQINDVDVLFDDVVILHDKHIILQADCESLSRRFVIEKDGAQINDRNYLAVLQDANRNFSLRAAQSNTRIDLEMLYNMLVHNPSIAETINHELTK